MLFFISVTGQPSDDGKNIVVKFNIIELVS